MGGFDGRDILSSAEVYNPTKKEWTLISDMSTPRDGCAAVSLGRRIVVVGGFDGKERLSLCEVYDPATGKWSNIASMHTKRRNCAAVEVEGTLFVIGGYDKNFLTSMESLPLFEFLLDEQPDWVKELDIDDNVMPTFLSFVGQQCRMLTLWKIIRNRQDLLTIE
uniref:Uncharacterized protein n=1 Tax=Helicotheca tamesis TaxID=374047 RepID=A0A7S2GXF3_9STRA|mmetsp:Transcript_13096/g.18044  ORF Transcript_13096/g.18044 Transcript_13096/m.18044 type:complete len:164 (+) Transcript_13096:72-563(+)